MDRVYSGGGSRALAELIDEHGGAIISDLLHYYSVDIRQLLKEEDPISPRYVLNLIVNLPKDGAFYASRRGGPQYRGWDEDRYALAALIDAQQAANYMFIMANRDPKRPKPTPPKPYFRPDGLDTTSSKPTPGSFAAMVVAAKVAHRKKDGPGA